VREPREKPEEAAMNRSSVLAMCFLTAAVFLLYLEHAEAAAPDGEKCTEGFSTVIPDAGSPAIGGTCGTVVVPAGKTNPVFAKTSPSATGYSCSNNCSQATGRFGWTDAKCEKVVGDATKVCDCSGPTKMCPTNDTYATNRYKWDCGGTSGSFDQEVDGTGKAVKYNKDGTPNKNGSYFKYTYSCNYTSCVYKNNGDLPALQIKKCGFKTP